MIDYLKTLVPCEKGKCKKNGSDSDFNIWKESNLKRRKMCILIVIFLLHLVSSCILRYQLFAIINIILIENIFFTQLTKLIYNCACIPHTFSETFISIFFLLFMEWINILEARVWNLGKLVSPFFFFKKKSIT